MTIPIDRGAVVDRYFIEHRAKAIDIAAFLDRIDRAKGADASRDFRHDALLRAIAILLDGKPDRARRVLESFSDPSTEPIAKAPMKGALGRTNRLAERHTMYIDPHIHMVSRTTDDYERMRLAGCVAITEPAFWAGYDRSSAQGFYDYFRLLTEFEPRRAAQYGIKHHTWLCINPKEAEDPAFAREVLAIIPQFLDKPNVLGIGEIGLNKNSRNELTILEEHLQLAVKHKQMVLVHTPHLEDKLKGTKLILDAIRNQGGLDPGRVLIDHVEEHTVRLVLERGFWAGMTLYPDTKCTPQRAVDIIEMHGSERIWINSAGDWGHSDPLAVPKAQIEMRTRGHAEQAVKKISFDNPLKFLNQSGRFSV